MHVCVCVPVCLHVYLIAFVCVYVCICLQLGLVTIRLYDALLRQQPIPAGEMTLLPLYER